MDILIELILKYVLGVGKVRVVCENGIWYPQIKDYQWGFCWYEEYTGGGNFTVDRISFGSREEAENFNLTKSNSVGSIGTEVHT